MRANPRVQNRGMNLRDIPERPRARINDPIGADDLARFARQMMENENWRLPPLRTGWNQPFRPGPTMVPVRQPVTAVAWDEAPTAATPVAIEYWRQILTELHEAWMELERARVRPDRHFRVGIRLTAREWNILRTEAPWAELRNAGLPVEEGVAMTFRGYPLFITNDPLR